MSMLAERKSKQKWCLNPRGKDWAEDANRFGQKMLEKMGWSNGKGLGAKLDGIKEHVKISYKNDSRGMGFKETGDQWTEHEDNFSKLLAQLKDSEHTTKINRDSSQPKSLEKISKSSRARVHYHKFTRGKDLSRYSEKDLANIFGRKELSKPVKQEKESSEPNSEDELRFGVHTLTGGSMVDYFKKKNPNLQVGVKSEFRVGKNGVLVKNVSDSDSERPSFGFGFQNGDQGKEDESDTERPAFGFGFQSNNFIKRNEENKKSLYNGFVKSEDKFKNDEEIETESKLNKGEEEASAKLDEENVSPRKKCKKGKKSEDSEDKLFKKKCKNEIQEEHKSLKEKKKSKSKSSKVNLEESPKQDSEAELNLEVDKLKKSKSNERANFKKNSSKTDDQEAELNLEVNVLSSKKKSKSKSIEEQTNLEECNSFKKIKNKNTEDASSNENKSPRKKMKSKQLDEVEEAECKSPRKKLKGHDEDLLNAPSVYQDGEKLKKKKKKSKGALQYDGEENIQESTELNAEREAKSKEKKNRKGKSAEDVCEDAGDNKEENYSTNNENEAKESETPKKIFKDFNLNNANEESGKKKSNKRKHEASFISYLNDESVNDSNCKKKRKFNEEDNSEVIQHEEKKKKEKLSEAESREDIGDNMKIESDVNEERLKKNKKKSKDKNAAGDFLHKLEEKFNKKKKENLEESNGEEKTKKKSKKLEIGIDNVCFEDFNATEVNEVSDQKISKKKKKKSKKENAGIENSCFEDFNDAKENSKVENPYEVKMKQKNKKKVTNKEEEGGRCAYENPNFSVNDNEEIGENCKKNTNFEYKRPEQQGLDNRALAINQDDIIEDDLVLNVTSEPPPTPIIVTPAGNSKPKRRKSVRFSSVNEECIIPSKEDQSLSIEEYRKKMELFDINAKVIQRGLEQQRRMELESGCVNGGFDIRTADSTSFYSRTLETKQTSSNAGVANIGFNDVQEIAERIDNCQAQVENDINEAKDNRANVLIGESEASNSNVDRGDAVRLRFKNVTFKSMRDYSLQYDLDSPKRSYKHLIKGDILLHFKNTNLGDIKGYATSV